MASYDNQLCINIVFCDEKNNNILIAAQAQTIHIQRHDHIHPPILALSLSLSLSLSLFFSPRSPRDIRFRACYTINGGNRGTDRSLHSHTHKHTRAGARIRTRSCSRNTHTHSHWHTHSHSRAHADRCTTPFLALYFISKDIFHIRYWREPYSIQRYSWALKRTGI